MGCAAVIELTSAPGSLMLKGQATRTEARELARLLLDTVDACQNGAVAFDWSGLDAIDLAGAQVLIAFKRSVAPGNLHWGPCAPAVLSYLQSCGLASLFFES
jgi:anti-anti-sigma regulatory factor